jgi:hypothetical protein
MVRVTMCGSAGIYAHRPVGALAYRQRWRVGIFVRFKRKRLGASKYSNLIFERFIDVFILFFSANQKIVNLLHCWEGEEGMRTFRG